MKIVFIGCVEFSLSMLEHILTLKQAQVVGIVTRQASALNADFRSLGALAEEHGIPCLYVDKDRERDVAAWIRKLAPDVVYCFGWSRLLKQDVLTAARLGVIGYHPAALPANRGRHPIIWALALGLTETASTFFFMDEGADSGDILSQERVPISEADDAASLYGKLIRIAKDQVSLFTDQLASGQFSRMPQDPSRATSWRKRSVKDGEIDWRMSARSIHNLVRALSRPYPGAHFIYRDRPVRAWKTEIADSSFPPLSGCEPGKVVGVRGSVFFVKCGEGVVGILEHELDEVPQEGTYL